MIETAKGRVLVVALLLTCHAGLFTLYAQQPVNPDAGVYPGGSVVVETPQQYLGKQVVVEGVVQEVSPVVIGAQTSDGIRRVTVTDVDFDAEIGDKLRIFGTVRGAQTIESHSGFAVPESGLWYTWSISFIAGLWVLVRLLSHWRLDVSQLRFVRRDRPLTVRDLIDGVYDA